MKLLCCSVFDSAVGAFIAPYYARSKSEAIRIFADLINDPNSNFSKHYTDYSLFCVGGFDDASGSLEPLTANEKFITGTECKANGSLQ